jgi:hypothetical protein
MIESGATVSRDQIWESTVIEFDPAYKYHIEIEYDYCSGYEDRIAEVFLIKYTLTEEENPKYATELRKYKKDQKEMDDRGKQWDELKPLWDIQQLEKSRKKDLALLKELKAKYEKNSN